MNALTVCNISVRQDTEGRYCLNDFHKAAGGRASHAPNHWKIVGQTQELLRALLTTDIPAIKMTAGRYGGTYVCKEFDNDGIPSIDSQRGVDLVSELKAGIPAINEFYNSPKSES